jgi:hypothetical protein
MNSTYMICKQAEPKNDFITTAVCDGLVAYHPYLIQLLYMCGMIRAVSFQTPLGDHRNIWVRDFDTPVTVS